MVLNENLTRWLTPKTLFVTIIVYISYKLVYTLFLSPLKDVPGPLFAKASGLYSFFMDMAGCRAKTIEKLHQKYGSVVQVGPKEVSFDSIDLVDVIYGASGDFIKSPWYDGVTRDGVFKLRNVAQHRLRRKQISRGFSPATANELEPNTAIMVKHFVSVIEERRQKGPLEMRHWFRMFVFDLAGINFTGEANGGLQCETSPQFVKDTENAFLIWDLEGRFPILMWFVHHLPIKSLQHILNGTDRLYEYSTSAFKRYISAYGRDEKRNDIVSKLFQPPAKDVEPLSDFLITCEMANLTFAATDTTSIVLSFLFWELAQNVDVQENLRSELRQNAQLSPDTGIPLNQSLANLPLLNAAIHETMRAHSPVPMGLPRQVPPGGRMMDGYFIPGDTIVSVSSWITQRNPTIFPEPDAWKPARWIDEKPDTRGYMPFGKGRHKCVGEAIAWVTMRVTVATLVLKYHVELAKDAKPSDMDWDDHVLIVLKRGCYLNFTPIS